MLHKLLFVLVGAACCLSACTSPTEPVNPPARLTSSSPASASSLTAASTTPPGSPPTPTQTNTPAPTRSATATRFPTQTVALCPPFPIDTKLPDPDLPANYIGLHFGKDLPQGLERQMGRVLEVHGALQHGLVILEWKETRLLFWLEQFICHDLNGNAYWEILDAIDTSTYAENETLAGACYRDGQPVPWVYAIGTTDMDSPPVLVDQQFYGWLVTDIRFAWRIDLTAEKFVQESTDGLECYIDVGMGGEP